MIFLLPSWDELASAGRGLEAFVGRQTPGCQSQSWPAASFLPGEAAQWAMERCDVRGPRLFLSLWGLGWVITAPSCLCLVGWGRRTSVFPAILTGASANPRREQWGSSDSSATFQKTSLKLLPQLGPPKLTGTTIAFIWAGMKSA